MSHLITSGKIETARMFADFVGYFMSD